VITAEKATVINAPIADVFAVIADFESYPEFQEEIESVEIVKETAKSATVAFEMNLMQRVSYTLKFNLKKPSSITWTFVEGDSMLKDNNGSWTITELEPGVVDVTYKINVEFSLWLPSSIVESLLGDHLPKMLKKFKERIEA